MSSKKYIPPPQETVKTLAWDTIVGSLYFLIIFSIAIVLSEGIHFASYAFENSGFVTRLAQVVKYVMLFFDVVLLLVFLMRQSLVGLCDLVAPIFNPSWCKRFHP